LSKNDKTLLITKNTIQIYKFRFTAAAAVAAAAIAAAINEYYFQTILSYIIVKKTKNSLFHKNLY
jgi:hypothetical protein